MNVKNLRAFTRVELICAIAAVVVVASIGLAVASSLRAKSRQAGCVSNLKQVGIAFRLWAKDCSAGIPTTNPGGLGDGRDYVPGQSSLVECFATIGDSLSGPKILVCPIEVVNKARDHSPADFSRLSDRTISYFIGIEADETKPQMILTGDRNLCSDLDGKLLFPADGIRTNALKLTASWQQQTIHRGRGNIGLADGSAWLMTTKQLLSQLRDTGDTNNTVLLPKP